MCLVFKLDLKPLVVVVFLIKSRQTHFKLSLPLAAAAGAAAAGAADDNDDG